MFADFAKRTALQAAFSDDVLLERLVLKGGNLLDIVFGVSPRASLDLDFSIEGEFEDSADLHARFVRALRSTFLPHRLIAFDVQLEERPTLMTEDLSGFWGGYRVTFKLIDQEKFDNRPDDLAFLRRNARGIGVRNATKFTIDISKHEYCGMKEEVDFAGMRIVVYPPCMVIAEKLRAICQQMPEYGS